MGRKKINYREGDCFVIPLRGGGFARGVVARLDGRGTVLGYFYGPKLTSEYCAAITDDLVPQNAQLVKMFGDLGLLDGAWHVVGRIVAWRREEWPLPIFQYKYDDTGETVLRHYDDQTLEFCREEKVKAEMVENYPTDGLYGYGAIEIRLAKCLN
jgi:hypothetical protein